MGKGASSTNSTETTNVDKSLTAASGDIFALQDTQLDIANGGAVSIVTNDPGVALRAIEAVENQGERLASTVQTLSTIANESARQVAKSQESFVEVASGQKSVITAVAIVGGVVALVTLPSILKK